MECRLVNVMERPFMSPVERNVAGIAPLHVAQAPAARRYRKVSYSTLSVEAITQVVVQDYGLCDSVNCVLYQRGMNDTYLLTTPDRQYALRVARANVRSRDALLEELATLRHFGKKGVKVALPIARSDGGWITDIQAPEGLRRAVAFNWAVGRAPKWTEPLQMLQYGRSVARLHDASDDLAAGTARPVMDAEYLLEGPTALIRSHLTHLPAEVGRLDALVNRISRRLSYAEMQLDDWGFCHGDVHPGNARIDCDQVALFDFDSCVSGWRLYDLASYRCEARRRGVEELAWTPFVEGYLQIRPAAAELFEFIGLFMILRHLWMAAQLIVLAAEMGFGFIPEEFLESLVSFCEKIELDIDGPFSAGSPLERVFAAHDCGVGNRPDSCENSP
jgi:Ser/Thr protein kinase RdoA (MazF antagonist)